MSRKVKSFLIDDDSLLELVRQHTNIEVPEGAEVVGVQHKTEYLGFLVGYKHDSFDEVVPGVQAPLESLNINK